MESNSLRISYKWLLPAYCSPNKEETRQVSWRNLNSIAVKLNGGDLLSRYIKVKQRRNLPIRINAANSVIRLINTQFLATYIYIHGIGFIPHACIHASLRWSANEDSTSLSLQYFLLLLKTLALTPYEIVSTFHGCWQIADLIFHRFVHLLINPSPRLIIFSSFGSRSFRKRFMRKLHSYVESSLLIHTRESIWRIFEIRREEVSSLEPASFDTVIR